MAGGSEWVNALVEYRQMTLTHRFSKSDSSYGYPFSVIHDKLWYYNFVLGGCLCSIQMSTNRHIFSLCIDVMKGMFLCKALSQAVTHKCTIINLHTNAKVGVEAHIITQTKKFKSVHSVNKVMNITVAGDCRSLVQGIVLCLKGSWDILYAVNAEEF
jgi:hypothetical protein